MEVRYEFFEERFYCNKEGMYFKFIDRFDKDKGVCAIIEKTLSSSDINIPSEIETEIKLPCPNEDKDETIEFSTQVKQLQIDLSGIKEDVCFNIPFSIDKISIEKKGTNVSHKIAFYVAEDNKFYCSDDFCLYNKSKTELIHFYTNDDLGHITLPDSIEKIHDYAFSGMRIEKLILPTEVTEVSFATLDAYFIGEVECKGNVIRVDGTSLDSTPRTLKINNLMSKIEWGNYPLFSGRFPRKILTVAPDVNDCKQSRYAIKLHGVVDTAYAMKYHLDYIPIIITTVNANGISKCSIEKKDDGSYINIGTKCIIVVKEIIIETYKGEHKGSRVCFVEEGKRHEWGYDVFESVDKVNSLIDEYLR